MHTAVTNFLILSTQLFNGQAVQPNEDYVFSYMEGKPTFVPRLNSAEVLKSAAFESKDDTIAVMDAMLLAGKPVVISKEEKDIEIDVSPQILFDFLNVFTERSYHTVQLSSVTVTAFIEEGKPSRVQTTVNKTKRVALGFRVH